MLDKILGGYLIKKGVKKVITNIVIYALSLFAAKNGSEKLAEYGITFGVNAEFLSETLTAVALANFTSLYDFLKHRKNEK